jgi:hypothetical protein
MAKYSKRNYFVKNDASKIENPSLNIKISRNLSENALDKFYQITDLIRYGMLAQQLDTCKLISLDDP